MFIDNRNRNRSDPLIRTVICEYCGDSFPQSQTEFKICHGKIRSICWFCILSISDSERNGIDKEKKE